METEAKTIIRKKIKVLKAQKWIIFASGVLLFISCVLALITKQYVSAVCYTAFVIVVFQNFNLLKRNIDIANEVLDTCDTLDEQNALITNLSDKCEKFCNINKELVEINKQLLEDLREAQAQNVSRDWDPIDVVDDHSNIKTAPVGAYILYDKTHCVIDESFVSRLVNMNIDILYLNTVRKAAPLSYDEWFSIFEMFKYSSIKIMLYIYEAVSLSPKWTEEQIRTISSHPSFCGWIAEDEVKMSGFSGNNAWITRFHNQTWSDGERKWPNMSITYLPKLASLKADAIGENYTDYLETWAGSVDTVFADMYPIIASKKDGAQYNIEDEGTPAYSTSAGGEKWYEYLKAHLEFTNRHPELTHRLYMNVCKYITTDDRNALYIAHPKPTAETIRVQAYANVMSGSNGVMLFLLNDILYANGKQFCEAAFDEDFSVASDTFDIMCKFFCSLKFMTFKTVMANLSVKSLGYYNADNTIDDSGNMFLNYVEGNKEIFVSQADNSRAEYCTVLNLSLTESITISLKPGIGIIDLTQHRVYDVAAPEGAEYNLAAGSICFLRKMKQTNEE